ncbi:hypothetical protein Tco_0606319 [Tanacetum coccineum]
MSKLLYTRFTNLIIDYLLSLNQSIPCRSDSKLHSSQDDHPITKLLNTTNGDYRFGMEVPDAMINDAIKKKAGYKYDMAKKVENEKVKIDVVQGNKISYYAAEAIVGELGNNHQYKNLALNNSLRQKKKPVTREGLSATHNKYYSSSNTVSNATLYSSSSDESEESANETDDADESDMDLCHDNPHGDDDDARSYDNQDPPNNHEGENKKKRRKDVGELFSRSSRRNKSPMVIVQDDTPAMQPLDQADILIQNIPNHNGFQRSRVSSSKLEDACKACLDAQKLLADIQEKNLSTKYKKAELENNKLGPSQVAELDGKIMNGVGEMMRSQNMIIKIEKVIMVVDINNMTMEEYMMCDAKHKNLNYFCGVDINTLTMEEYMDLRHEVRPGRPQGFE